MSLEKSSGQSELTTEIFATSLSGKKRKEREEKGVRGEGGEKHKSLWYKSKAPSDIYDRKVENKNNTLYERALMEIGIKMWPCNKFASIRCAVNNGNPRRMNECMARNEYTHTFTNINHTIYQL